jgi:hypothetical protein
MGAEAIAATSKGAGPKDPGGNTISSAIRFPHAQPDGYEKKITLLPTVDHITQDVFEFETQRPARK